MNENTIFSADFETYGLLPYHPDFRIKSLAVAYSSSISDKINTRFFTDLEEIENCLRWLAETQAKVIVYNLGFEQLVMQCIYPDIKLNFVCDVMRLSQLRGLPENDTSKDRETGYSLKATTARFLKHLADYEQEAYTWIRENLLVPRGKEGGHLDKLPYDILKRYNENDTIATLQLYWYFDEFFREEGYDWHIDWELYKTLADFVIDAEIRGIEVDRKALAEYHDEIIKEVAEIDEKFVRKMGVNLLHVREKLKEKLQAKYKKKIITELPEFNITSKKHLEMLFVDEMGLDYTLKTPKGAPSFKAEHLYQFGDATKILEKRGKRLLVASQASAIQVISENDGKLHPKIRIVGTRTGRTANSSVKKIYGVSFNLQAAARTDKPLMSSFTAPPGCVFVSQDLSRGEPTITSYYTKDKNFRLVNCDMTGKKPYFQGDMLISDDQYITLGSITPFARKPINELIEKAGGLDEFGEKWLIDADTLKAPIKTLRKVLKTSALSLNYGAGTKRLYSRCNEIRCPITMEEAEMLRSTFWQLYPDVKIFADKCAKLMKRQGYIYNALGFRCVTEPRKAYNMLIQSSINGIISILIQEQNKLFTKASPIGIVHDELLTLIQEDDLEQYRKCCQEACYNLNEILGWDIPIRTGFAVGKNLYEAK